MNEIKRYDTNISREFAMKLIDDEGGRYVTYADHLAAVKAVRLHEREQCARICASVKNFDKPMTAMDCAEAIRARSYPTPLPGTP